MLIQALKEMKKRRHFVVKNPTPPDIKYDTLEKNLKKHPISFPLKEKLVSLPY